MRFKNQLSHTLDFFFSPCLHVSVTGAEVHYENTAWHYEWAPQLKPQVRKRGLYCISSIYTFQLSLKRFAQHDLKSWSITYEQDVWWSYTHGNKPNMDRSVLTILVQLTAASHFPPPPSSPSLICPAELLPMLSVAATFLGYTANDANKKEEKQQQVGRGKSQVHLTSVQRTQCWDSMQKWILTWHGIWIKWWQN